MDAESECSEWVPRVAVQSLLQLTQCTTNSKDVVLYNKVDLAELIFIRKSSQQQTTYNLNEKGKIPENIGELTDILEHIEQAVPKAMKPSKGHKERITRLQEASNGYCGDER